jgi:DNA repair protein SbcC/Rad50
MRPHELTLRGFRSYRDEVTFDFRGRHLVGIVGPIGAGKSTILDAIAFALFGRTPRVQRETRSLVHQLSDAAHVQLLFEVDGARWRVTRALKRKGQGQTKLERVDDAGDALETIVMDKPVRGRIEQLLGMDFDTFGRSVLLAQNRFAEFLLATDAPRNAVLKGVFGYERFDTALALTKERVAGAEATVDALDADGVRVVETRAALAEADEQAEGAAADRDALLALLPRVQMLDATIAEAVTAAAGAAAVTDRVIRAQGRAPATRDVSRARERAEAASALVRTATEEVDQATEAADRAEAVRAAATEAVGDLQAFADLVAQLNAHADAVHAAGAALDLARAAEREAEEAIAAAGEASDAAAHERMGAEATETAARATAQETDDALHAARHAEMATSLRADLTSGEPCPVCGQAVITIPKVAKRASLRRAEKARSDASAALTKATATRERASAAAANAAAAEVAARTERERRTAVAAEAEAAVRRAEGALATIQSAVVDRLGEGDPAVLLDERRAELREADAAARTASHAVRTARAQLDTARIEDAEATHGLGSLREQLVAAWGLLDERDPLPLTDDPASLADAEAHLRAELEHRATEAAAVQRAATSAVEITSRDRAALLTAAEIAPEADVVALVTAAEVRAAEAEERRRGFAATVEAGADLDARIAAERAHLGLLRRLRDDLQPSRFLAWLLGEERAALAELASVHLEALTDGDFRFSDDESFRIVDVNAAGTEREPDSLSGGETFLASLALALALADMVTRGGGRLDSFFLDEGFGSLDSEHIERAMSGIEHLVHDGGDRLVILVSHVAQMHELLEDLIVLEKDEVAGSSRIVAGASRA